RPRRRRRPHADRGRAGERREARSQARDLRRAWRGAEVGRLLPRPRPRLRELLALPRAGRAVGGGAGGAEGSRRGSGRRRRLTARSCHESGPNSCARLAVVRPTTLAAVRFPEAPVPGTGASATTANVEEMSVPAVLRVVAAAVVVERRLLLMSKRAAPEVFYLPGGKPDQGESELDCLRREIAEELSVGIVQPRLWASVTSPAALEGCPMEMTVYRAELDGEPKAA